MLISTPIRASARFLKDNLELTSWTLALVILFFLPVGGGQSLCIYKAMGFTACPGCGIGNSMHAALRLQLASSVQQHPLGIIAILIIFNRIRTLCVSVNNTP